MVKIEGEVGRTDLLLYQPIEPVTSGCKDSAFLHIRFSKHWRDYRERFAVFRSSERKWSSARLDSGGLCTIPEEALRVSGTAHVSVVGIRRTDRGIARAVSELAPITVTRGGNVSCIREEERDAG